MAAKKKTKKKKSSKSGKTLASKSKPLKKRAKKPAKKVARPKSGKKAKRVRRVSRRQPPQIAREELGPDSAGQSGDIQGLSDTESADSESVDELVEEGNAFEAEAVAGVEEADDDGVREVHTHEVPEDDVPEEYLDQD